MSTDACKIKNSNLLKRVNNKFFSDKLQNVGLSLVASVSKKKQQPIVLKPSVSARPFSQFFFPPIKEEDDQQQTTTKKSKPISSSITVESNSSSRSSSLKTIRNCPLMENNNVVVISSPEEQISVVSDFSFIPKKTNTNRLSRARTVLGLDSIKSKELQAINVWKDTVSQLSNEEDLDSEDELYTLLSHPALIPESPLERQRFVRQQNAKDVAMMKFILNELVDTEKSYNQLLLLIKHRYMQPMIAASKKKDPLVKSTDIPVLFNHLTDLIALSDKLLHQFEKTNKIGNIFRSLESDLVVFLKYAMHYRKNTKLIKRACSNVLFVKIDQECLTRRDSNRLGMSDYFIAPIQRIPRYCLLIKDLQKYTYPSHTADLDAALKILTGLAVAMDHVQNKPPSSSRASFKTL